MPISSPVENQQYFHFEWNWQTVMFNCQSINRCRKVPLYICALTVDVNDVISSIAWYILIYCYLIFLLPSFQKSYLLISNFDDLGQYLKHNLFFLGSVSAFYTFYFKWSTFSSKYDQARNKCIVPALYIFWKPRVVSWTRWTEWRASSAVSRFTLLLDWIALVELRYVSHEWKDIFHNHMRYVYIPSYNDTACISNDLYVNKYRYISL